MGILELHTAADLSDESTPKFDVRHVSVRERVSELFAARIVAMHSSPNVDFDAIVGQTAHLYVNTGRVHALETSRVWSGVISHLEQLRTEPGGLSTYTLVLVPDLWLLTQRRNYRIFQMKSELEITQALLAEWNIEPELKITDEYKKRKYKVQYAESDYAFISRILADVGISFWFERKEGATKLIIGDRPQANEARGSALTYVDSPNEASERDFVTGVHVAQKVRPTKYTLQDHDYRRPPEYRLVASAGSDEGPPLERRHYVPGGFLFVGGQDSGEATPGADDRGKARADEREGQALAQKRLDAKRAEALAVTFESNAIDLAPGVVITIEGHPRDHLNAPNRQLVLEAQFDASHDGNWSTSCRAVSAKPAYRPPVDVPRPKVVGVESATVVGPAGEEIHTDEFGRVRVHFHWDRESQMNDSSSCWVHVSQPWGGSGYGGVNLPRIGQEVLVEFLGGDPDRPVIIGRVYTNLQKVPYRLPENKTMSGWRSNSSPGGGGFNEMSMEDAAGRERVFVHAQKDMDTVVLNQQTLHVHGFQREQIDTSAARYVKPDQYEEVTGTNRRKVIGEETIEITNTQDTVVTNKISRDTKEILEHASIKVEILGDNSILIQSINGQINIKANGNCNIQTNSDCNITSHAQTNINATADCNVTAPNINLNC